MYINQILIIKKRNKAKPKFYQKWQKKLKNSKINLNAGFFLFTVIALEIFVNSRRLYKVKRDF